MDFNPFQDSANFVDLLNSQQNVVFGSQGSVSLSSSQPPFVASQHNDLPAERKERRTWTVTEDIVLISAWLNTSKDPVVDNEQRGYSFWIRVATYFSASPKVAESDKRGRTQCKQRWHKLNEAVCKFCGAYEAATREKSSGMNDNDVLKLAHKIYFNKHRKKFILEHAWNSLCNDQKWCQLFTEKNDSSSKRRKFVDGSHSVSSQMNENDAAVDGDEGRPLGVKAAKRHGKKAVVEGKEREDFDHMWELKKEDLILKLSLSKMNLLSQLSARQGNLDDTEEVLKKKLIEALVSAGI
ncbi:glutathione S-transferase T3-like [Brassica napus]|uniref:glutathione S-transferase T3-like n=1 Tax=Brassica napus TaxID=3708 RepID=UPI00207AD0AA|nr:glutathione S-transferase T3-like [Brassica napus]